MPKLSTLAPQKFVQNFSGATPTLDVDDDVLLGDYAVDTSNDALWKCIDNTAGAPVWVEMTAKPAILTNTPGSAYTITSTRDAIIKMDSSGAGAKIACTLPALASTRLNRSFFIIMDAGTQTIDVTPAGTDKINAGAGGAPVNLSAAFKYVEVKKLDTAKWTVVNSN